MGPELAVFRAIIELFWPTLCLAKMAILNTVIGVGRLGNSFRGLGNSRRTVLHTHTSVVEKGGKKEKERACVVAIT